MLKQLCQTFVRFKIIYGREVLSSAADTHFNKLKHIQNSSLRICLGCVKITPVQAMEIELIIEPINILLNKIVWHKYTMLLTLKPKSRVRHEYLHKHSIIIKLFFSHLSYLTYSQKESRL